METPDPLWDEGLPDVADEVPLLTDEELESFAEWLDDNGFPRPQHHYPDLTVLVGNTLDGFILDDV